MSQKLSEKLMLIVLLVISSLIIAGCGSNITEEQIIANIPAQLKPISEFEFVEGSPRNNREFTFRAANGSLYEGSFDGEYIEFNLASN